jgi:hypothetical protein
MFITDKRTDIAFLVPLIHTLIVTKLRAKENVRNSAKHYYLTANKNIAPTTAKYLPTTLELKMSPVSLREISKFEICFRKIA